MERRVPGRGWYVVAGLIALSGVGGAVAALVPLFSVIRDNVQFVVPGQRSIELAKPGRYMVWNDHSTLYEGRTYRSGERMPEGVTISVMEATHGTTIPVRASHGATAKIGSTERLAVATFDAPLAGRYEIAVEGRFPERVFSVGPEMFVALLLGILGAAGAALLGTGGGIALAAWAYFRRQKAGHPVAAGEKTMTAPAQETNHSLSQLTTLVYALQALSFVAGITLIAAAIVNYIKRDAVAGTIYESHFRWQIRTFWFCLLWGAIGVVLMFALVGFAVLAADAIWLIYRIVKGWLALNEGKPVET